MKMKEIIEMKRKLDNLGKIKEQKIFHDDVIERLNIVIYMDQDYNTEIELMDEEVDIERYSFNDLLEFSNKIQKMKNDVALIKQAYIEKLMNK